MQVFDVGSFERLVFAGEGSVVLAQSGGPGLSIRADDNLHEYIDAIVDDSTLTISTADGIDIAPSDTIDFQVDFSDLAFVELRGVGTITAERLAGDAAAFVLSGAGDITVEELRVGRVNVDHHGVGTIRLAGEVDDSEVSVSGPGKYEGGELVSRIATVAASGTGEAVVSVTEDLSCVVSDSGLVAFYGTPTVSRQVSGSGSVVALGDA